MKDIRVVQTRGEYRKLRSVKFAQFVKEGWPALLDEGCVIQIDRELEWNFAIEALVAHWQAVGDGLIKKLIINIPPGCLKSGLAAILYPCWLWTLRPRTKFMFGTYMRDLTLRDAHGRLALIGSKWYKDKFGDVFKITKEAVGLTINDKGGTFFATSTDSAATGFRCDQLIIDDPEDPRGVESDIKRVATTRWLRRIVPSRVNNGPYMARVVQQQRLDENDATALHLALGGWTHLSIPCEYNGKSTETPYFKDPRIVMGQTISDYIYPQALREERKNELGPYSWFGQYQQEPIPPEGGMIKRDWIKFYKTEDGRVLINQ